MNKNVLTLGEDIFMVILDIIAINISKEKREKEERENKSKIFRTPLLSLIVRLNRRSIVVSLNTRIYFTNLLSQNYFSLYDESKNVSSFR